MNAGEPKPPKELRYGPSALIVKIIALAALLISIWVRGHRNATLLGSAHDDAVLAAMSLATFIACWIWSVGMAIQATGGSDSELNYNDAPFVQVTALLAVLDVVVFLKFFK